MSVSPNELLSLADVVLRNATTEAEWRNAVGRAYYAVFHAATSFHGSLPSPEMIFKVYQDEFDQAYKEGTMFMLTTHPMISGHRSRIMYLEKLIVYMKSKPGVWFATGQQIADYVKQNSK